MPYQKSCQRKLGELTLVSETPPPGPYTPGWFLDRVVAGVLDVDKLREKLREVYAACFPNRQFVRVKIVDFYKEDTSVFPLYAHDTNSHGYDQFGRTAARLKSGASYKRPGHDLCPAGHVPLVWGSKGVDAFSDTLRASLPTGIVKAALSELEAIAGRKPDKIEVRVQMIELRPGEWTSRRAFMSWGLA